MIEKSGLFDREWYLARYPDVARTGLDPIYHYFHFGAAELRNPSLAFDTRNYLDMHPDVEASGLNPLLHFVKFGLREDIVCRGPEQDSQ
jgi:hypothetical protein